MIRTFSLVACLLSACAAVAWSQQPRPTQPVEAKAASELSAQLVADDLARYVDYALIDMSKSLIADNGLGIDVAPPEAALRAQLGLDEGAGLVVTSAPEESLGAKAGLRVHDVILKFGDQQSGEIEKLKEWLGAADGKVVTLKVLRGGKPLEIQVMPKKPESARVRVRKLTDLAEGWKHLAVASQERYRIGVSLSEADDTLRAQLRLAAGEGLVVTEVIKDSAAAAAGMQVNDVLTVLDGKRLTTVDAINAQVQEIKDRLVDLRLLRAGEERILQVTPRKSVEAAFHDRAVRYWDMQSCQKCHAQPFDDAQAAHLMMKWKLGAHHSAWTDGEQLHLYGKLFNLNEKPAAEGDSQKQLEVLKSQLAEMQKTLAALESSLAASKEEQPQPQEKK